MAYNLYSIKPIVHTVAVFLMLACAEVQAGNSFTLIADEDNTKDMSVNLFQNLLGNERVEFAGLKFPPVILTESPLAVRKRYNHDSGVLDVAFNLLIRAPATSASMLQFSDLKQQLELNCWQAADASELDATLRLYAIPPTTVLPNGQRVHHRLNGTSPHGFVPPQGSGDFPPASMPVGVYAQQTPWHEGDVYHDFFDVTIEQQHVIDVTRAGVVAPGTDWEGFPLEPVDLCLNRVPGAQAEGLGSKFASLCYDTAPGWEPWMEWDVSGAVRDWLADGFDATNYHGFAIFQQSADSAENQTRMNNLQSGNPLSRATLTFASSSAVADCEAAGGAWGGNGVFDFDGGMACRNKTTDAVITPGTRLSWRPQLVITDNTAATPASFCMSADDDIDSVANIASESSLLIKNHLASENIDIQSIAITGPDAASFAITDTCDISPQAICAETITFQSSRVGSHSATVEVTAEFLDGGMLTTETLSWPIAGTISQDDDGIVDAIEDLAPNSGDSNSDGIADSTQDNVAALRMVVNQRDPEITGFAAYTTLVAPSAKPLRKVKQHDLTIAGIALDANFTSGFYGFELHSLLNGEAVDVQVILPRDDANRYFSYDPTVSAPSARWSGFEYDGDSSDITGAEYDGRTVTLHLQDGGRGDIDGVANGEIVHMGGAGFLQLEPEAIQITDATVGALGPWMVFVGSALLLIRVTARRM